VALLTIRLVPDPILFRKARKIAKITAQHRKLAIDMIETLTEHHGVGLAANQVGVLERLCVIQTPDMEEAMVLVNPEIVHREGEREVEEGCLSVPGYRGMVVRAELVRTRALDLNSKKFKLEADELMAQALEHEIDHLNGIMYLDHLVAHTSVYKIEEQPDGSEEDAKYEADENGDEHGNGHDDQHGHEHSPQYDALHQQLHEMRGDADAPDPAETTAQQETST
jgi:peptide deformylase